ncbi:MAG: hypothetical protein HY840_15635 [Bacteroidetes bacterium]|nr:hypothetical protein [Bacteroidota bacterium]
MIIRTPKIIIIGNGFDLNLGLKTAYSDFTNSYYFASLINNNFCNYLRGKQELDNGNWIDIENELSTYSKIKSDSFERDFLSLSSALIQYLLEIDYNEIDKRSIAYSLLKKNINQDFFIYDYNYTNTVYELLSSRVKKDF